MDRIKSILEYWDGVPPYTGSGLTGTRINNPINEFDNLMRQRNVLIRRQPVRQLQMSSRPTHGILYPEDGSLIPKDKKKEAPIFQGGTLPVTDITAEPIGKGKYLAEFDKRYPRQEYKETNEYIRRFQPEKVVQKQAWRDAERNRRRDNYAESYMIRDKDLKMQQEYEKNKQNLPWWQKRVEGVNTTPQQKEQILEQQAKGRLEWSNKPLEHKAGWIASETAMALVPELFFLKGTGKGTQIAKNLSNTASDIPTSSIINKVDDAIKPLSNTTNKTDDLVQLLRKELSENGIVKSQKTLNLLYKEPIRKGVEPWGYTADNPSMFPITGSKFKDVIGAILGGDNPSYLSDRDILMKSGMYDFKLRKANDLLIKEGKPPIYTEEMKQILKKDTPIINDKKIKDALNHRDRIKYTEEGYENVSEEFAKMQKNRYATWDMYLGKPQTKHPLYDISELTTSKKDVIYTIKEEFMNKAAIEERFSRILKNIDDKNVHIIPDKDSGFFGTMGGFHWEVSKLPNGNYKIFANDIWDLHPFQNFKIGLNNKFIEKLANPIRKIEIGKALGIGKPLNVKVGFIVDGNTKKIIKTFGVAPTVTGSLLLKSKTNEDEKSKR